MHEVEEKDLDLACRQEFARLSQTVELERVPLTSSISMPDEPAVVFRRQDVVARRLKE